MARLRGDTPLPAVEVHAHRHRDRAARAGVADPGGNGKAGEGRGALANRTPRCRERCGGPTLVDLAASLRALPGHEEGAAAAAADHEAVAEDEGVVHEVRVRHDAPLRHHHAPAQLARRHHGQPGLRLHLVEAAPASGGKGAVRLGSQAA